MSTQANGPSIYCSAEWHLRDNPRACAIYSLALRLSNSSKTFFLSQPQLAQYFGWSLSAVKDAFRLLKKSGLFVLIQKGRGGDVRSLDFASTYHVLTHSELPKDETKDCWVKREKGPRVKNDPRSKNTQGEKQPSPRVENDPTPRVKNDPLVFDVSTKKSTNPENLDSPPCGGTDISISAPPYGGLDLDAALKDVWQHYLTATHHDPKLNTFTSIRKKIGMARLQECLAKASSPENAVKLMKVTIDAIAKSDFHMGRDAKTNGKKYNDWENHIFKSLEQMEKWWQA